MNIQKSVKSIIFLYCSLSICLYSDDIAHFEDLTRCASDQVRFKEALTDWEFLDQIQAKSAELVSSKTVDSSIIHSAQKLLKATQHLKSQLGSQIQGISVMNQLNTIHLDCKNLLNSLRENPVNTSLTASFQSFNEQIELVIATINETLLNATVCSHDDVLKLWSGVHTAPHQQKKVSSSVPPPPPQSTFPSQPPTIIVEEHPYYPYAYYPHYYDRFGIFIGPGYRHHHHHFR